MSAPERRARQRELVSIFWELNSVHFAGILPPVALSFSGRLKTTGGQYHRRPRREIHISERYFEMPDPWKEIRDTLGHELVHYWLDFLGEPCGHTPAFRRKLTSCGFARYSRLASPRMRFVYHCPACGLKYPRKRKGVWSCGPCSGPRFSSEFRLVLAESAQGR